ncbi:MAG: hypothetical protein AAFY88_12555, partial [Acidobacteriota bacterium]
GKIGSKKVKRRGGRLPITEEQADNLRAASKFLAPNPNIPDATRGQEKGGGVTLDNSFESLNFDDDPGSTPPDPELAVGPNHVIAVINTSFEIYDRTGATLVGPSEFSSLFTGVTGCAGGVFDPNVLYDEKEDRFIIAIDGGGNFYCVGATQTNDPTGMWNLYSFNTIIDPGDFFDYPHAGVGENFIFMGANVFGSNGNPFKGALWAIDKAAMYSGAMLPTPNLEVVPNGESTPQPMNAHGFAQGTWPDSGTHYIVTDGPFDGTSLGVWSWDGVGPLVSLGSINLNAASGVTGGFPTAFPQNGTNDIQGNDWRVQDAEYRNGSVWIAHTIACNPGGGSVNCVRWAELNPTAQGGPAVVQSGVVSSDGEFRQFPDLGVNHCNDMVIGYTKSSSSTFPSVYYSSRLGADPMNTTQPEGLIKAGEVAHTSFGNDPPPHRWGDYTGATSDPNGVELWYLGEYTRDNVGVSKWGQFVGHFSSSCDAGNDEIFVDGFEAGDCSAWSIFFGGCVP